jgi:two-component system chemotaxis sensor kinase CheA
MPSPAVVERFVDRFRALSFERLERIDAAWLVLTHGTAAPKRMEEDLFRDVHTMKGEAHLLGLGEIGRLCDRLEDVLFAVRNRQYLVPEEVNIVVIMALQLIAVLLKKRPGSPQQGVDLEGFLEQMGEVLGEFDRQPSEARNLTILASSHLRSTDASTELGMNARQRLGAVATVLYLEHLRATGASSRRLLESWRVLAREIALLETVSLAVDLSRHAAVARELARELDKDVEVVLDVGEDVRAATEVLDVINTVVLHGVRNALDHGIETSEQRRAAGKAAPSKLRIWARQEEDWVALCIEDDGAGVNLDRVRSRAIEKGYLTADEAAGATRDALLSLVFRFGFSTRDTPGELSGRGVGLDAARAAVERFGGSITLETIQGRGTTLTVRLPHAPRTMDVHVFPACGSRVLFAIPASYDVSPCETEEAVDPLAALDLPARGGDASARHMLVVREGEHEARIVAGGAVRTDVAARLCPAKEGGIEIVACGAGEAILIRPETLATEGALPVSKRMLTFP